jgi:ankyrin repeat protein/beta-lactamase regulating signal transducer with metallopeptidase domain
MTSVLAEAAVAISRSAELSILVKATVVVMLGLCGARLARHAQASTRHLILSLTCTALLSLPLAFVVVPGVVFQVPVVGASEPVPEATDGERPSAFTPSRADVAARSDANARRSYTPTISTLARVAWLSGTVLLLCSLAAAVWRLVHMRRRGLPWPELRTRARRLASDAGIRRPVEVLLHEDVVAPVTCGILRPTILLPPDAPEWSEADLRRALVHELEHVQRGDWATHLLARTACAVYWFHPLVWITLRQLSLEAERSCDDAVVQRAGHADYAEQLVQLARRLSNRPPQPTLAMASRSDLSARVSAILDGGQKRGRPGVMSVTLSVAAAILLVLTIAPVRAVRVMADDSATVAMQEVGPGLGLPAPLATAIDRALLEAADEGSLDNISTLRSAGANVNARILGDGSPLIAAARSGQIEAVRLLLDQGADPNLIVRGDGSPIIMAAREGHIEIVELLLSRAASVDQVAPDDENALIQASGEGHLPVVKLLIERGADVNARVWAERGYAGPDGRRGEWRTPLSMARRDRHDAVVAYLLSAGARQ